MWASIINESSEAFGRYPQVFVIANERGVEIGFSLAIHERDYFNEDVKLRARSMLPSLYRKLPNPSDPRVVAVDAGLSVENFNIGIRHRDGMEQNFKSVSELIAHHKSQEAGFRGGGTIYRLFDAVSVQQAGFNVESSLRSTLQLFEPLMRSLTPQSHDVEFVRNQYQTDVAVTQVEEFAPEDDAAGKTYALRKLAQRLGQQKFRSALVEAYNGACAISGTTELSSLQAAHICPYDGKRTNHVTNGILLRADIHNLFDLGLVYIDPESHVVVVSPMVECPTYKAHAGKVAYLPKSNHLKPSKQNLQAQADRYRAMHEVS